MGVKDQPLQDRGTNQFSVDSDFGEQWARVRTKVMAYCRRAAGELTDAEDVFQVTALRAWRGYPSFRGDSEFLTWVLVIARREMARLMGKKGVQQQVEYSLEVLEETAPALLISASEPEPVTPTLKGIGNLVEEAGRRGELSEDEVAVIRARLASPEANWQQIGAVLSINSSACAVMHCRAIPKFRVFLFIHYPESLGGLTEIRVAYASAVADRSNPLAGNERKTFQKIVLDRCQNYSKAGWRIALRKACDKVISYLTFPCE